MRIDLNHGPQATEESSSTGTQAAAARSSQSGLNIGEDQAQLSGAHVQVQALAAQASQLPEVRQERVTALRQAVASGLYHASAESVAGAIFDHLLAVSAA